MTIQDALKLAVVFGRTVVDFNTEPRRGELVVEVTRRDIDPDAIGYLVGHADAPWNRDDPLDGSVPMREVYDILPLNPEAILDEYGTQRWENAMFKPVPAYVFAKLGLPDAELPD